MKILDQSQERFIVQSEDGSVMTYPNNPYWYLKLVEFKGERIIYELSPKRSVVETYENMVFNVHGWNLLGQKGQNTITPRHKLANDVAVAILNHKDNAENYEMFNDLFIKFHNKAKKNFDVEYLETNLKEHKDRVKVRKDGYEVDERFVVQRDGSAYLLKDDLTRGKYLCVHAYGTLPDLEIKDGEKVKVFSSHSQQILSKIQYLLEPTPNCPHSYCSKDEICKVFSDQLPKKLKSLMQREFAENWLPKSILSNEIRGDL